MIWERLVVLKFIGLFIGCVAKFTTGSLFVFNVYQNAIKDTFNYTQQEVELFSSMLNIGLGVGFLPGMFYDRFGPQWASGLGLVVSVTGYMLIWSTTKNISFYSSNSWLMSIYFFVVGLGSVFTYMVALNTNIINFDQKHTGKIVGFLNAFFAGSPSVFATIYYHVFTHGDSTDTSNQDFPGFMLFFAISFAATDILCIIFLRIYRDDTPGFVKFDNEPSGEQEIENTEPNEEQTHEVFKFATNGGSYGANSVNVNPPTTVANHDIAQEEYTLWQILKNFDYQIFSWTFAFASSIGLVYTNNVTVISRSVRLGSHDSTLTILVPITIALVSAFVGVFSDYFKDRLPRMWIVIAGCLSFTISQILVLLFADKYALLILATILTGVGIAIIWSIPPTIMKEMFNVTNFGRNWGIAILIAALLGFGCQEVFGALYDAHTPGNGDIHCYGMKCIRGGTAIVVACGSFSVILGVVMQIRDKCCRITPSTV